MKTVIRLIKRIIFVEKRLKSIFSGVLSYDVRFFRHLSRVSEKSIILFPVHDTTLCCGLAGIVSVKGIKEDPKNADLYAIGQMIGQIESAGFLSFRKNNLPIDRSRYLGGKDLLDQVCQQSRKIKNDRPFAEIFENPDLRIYLQKLNARIGELIDAEEELFSRHIGYLGTSEVDIMSDHIERLKDIEWRLDKELAENICRVDAMMPSAISRYDPGQIQVYKNINAVFNSIDKLEVRGRDSAGVSLLFVLSNSEYEKFISCLEKDSLMEEFTSRTKKEILLNRGITVSGSSSPDNEPDNEQDNKQGNQTTSISIAYKTALEIGSLGDNVRFLRKQVSTDSILAGLAARYHQFHTVSSHTRWASVGAISEPNCHPLDNRGIFSDNSAYTHSNIIHVCLNGDIDNYLELKESLTRNNENKKTEEITTDTKIIPLQVERYIRDGHDVSEAFRLAVNDFDGSHAISMHTDLAPGKLFLAQKGSGQAVFIGLSDDHYIPASEVYGFVEETSSYLKLDGEKIIQGKNGPVSGQVFILDQESSGGLSGISAMYYDGSPITLDSDQIKKTEITSRDIDRQDFPHYFLKEISESPESVEKTLLNRWKVLEKENDRFAITLDDQVVPQALQEALTQGKIRRIIFAGQGTAGVAAMACAGIIEYYLNDPEIQINALKSSELSGFKLSSSGIGHSDFSSCMSDTLIIPISQSGTTTDTNRAVDMAKEQGAFSIAIVNRRDSDITFKTDGVFYTSSGRDIEMSVASTKAFYSQIVAGAVLGLYLAGLKKTRTQEFIASEIKQLLALPSHMRKILSMKEKIEKSAKAIAPQRTYWAAVGSGPNKASADEIRIKLSELCYKTISTDFVEDKKHIDLSSEPLIIICAAGTRESVLGDIIKDTAIFQAHKAIPVVIADEGEYRFGPYAENVINVPNVGEHLAPIVNTLAGHLWGYYAALSINDCSKFLFNFREDVRKAIDDHSKMGLDVYELILEKSFQEMIVKFYFEFRSKKADNILPSSLCHKFSENLVLLLKYLSGRLPVSDFKLDFGIRGTAGNMLKTLFECLSNAINEMARPVDAIKHQAKTVTVGTSRISEKTEGILFNALIAQDFDVSQLTAKNVLVLKNLQYIIEDIQGLTLYRIDGLNLLGEPTKNSRIELVKKEGTSLDIPSRVREDTRLKGTKLIIVRQGNVYIGKGRKDERSMLFVPIISASAAKANMIEYLLLLDILLIENTPLSTRIKALGGKYDHIKDIVQENSVHWDDSYLESIEMDELFGRSAEKIGERIVKRVGVET
ncbi:SIS domain-containing protein [Desulfobacterales bacterium HSG16]|nr:SIS domain-containing protein [Desulfobacterales bacterium HSG16]